MFATHCFPNLIQQFLGGIGLHYIASLQTNSISLIGGQIGAWGLAGGTQSLLLVEQWACQGEDKKETFTGKDVSASARCRFSRLML